MCPMVWVEGMEQGANSGTQYVFSAFAIKKFLRIFNSSHKMWDGGYIMVCLLLGVSLEVILYIFTMSYSRTQKR